MIYILLLITGFDDSRNDATKLQKSCAAVHIKSNLFYNLQIIWLSFLISLDI